MESRNGITFWFCVYPEGLSDAGENEEVKVNNFRDEFRYSHGRL